MIEIEIILEAIELIRKFPHDERLRREQLYLIEKAAKSIAILLKGE